MVLSPVVSAGAAPHNRVQEVRHLDLQSAVLGARSDDFVIANRFIRSKRRSQATALRA